MPITEWLPWIQQKQNEIVINNVGSIQNHIEML